LPHPEGSKLIFFTPFRAGANEENLFALEVNKRLTKKRKIQYGFKILCFDIFICLEIDASDLDFI
jgi:hypothetical protein